MTLSTPWRLTWLAAAALLVAASPQAQIFSNTTSIAIPGTGTAAGPASPYPSAIAVTGVGTVTDVNVTLTGFNHTFPDDVDVLLVGPDGTRLVLMSDMGGSPDAVNATFTFDDAAAAALPDALLLTTGSYKPGNITSGDVFPAPAPTTGTLATTLAAYNGLAANGTWNLYVADDANGDIGSISGGWSINFNNTPPPPTFSLSPSASQNFGTAGPCSIPSTSRVFTVTNTGEGTLSVTSASLSGDASFMLTSSLPASLAAGQSTTITVTFQPGASTNGAQASTLTVAYDTGTAQTATVALTGTADNVTNVSAGQGAGYLFANSSATGACASATPAPSGTGLIDFTTHTRIQPNQFISNGTTVSDDDGRFRIPEAAVDAVFADGGVRLFGRTYPDFWITTNGNLFFNPPANYNAAGDRNIVLPTTANGGVAYAAAAMDYELEVIGFATDDDGIAGLPGVFYGAADTDGDGTDELIITWYHAYVFGSAAYPNGAARYATFQAVIRDGGAPNVDDTFETRFLTGNDANGIPFTFNATTGGSPNIVADVVTGLSNAAGTASAEYHENTTGGPTFEGAPITVRFVPATQATASGAAGYRMMGAPVTGYTVARLADLNLVQGVTGQYPSVAPNVFTFAAGAYAAATDVANTLPPGKGFFWYLYNEACNPTVALCGGDPGPPATDGTSQSYTLPMMLQGTGQEPTADPVTAALDADNFNLVANPFRSSLDVTNLSAWAVGGMLTSGIGQIWDPVSASYVLTNDPAVNNTVSAWQGMFIQNIDATSLAVPASAKTTGGTFVGRDGEALVAFELTGTTAAGAATRDRAALVTFSDEATTTWDLGDASKLTPPVQAYATAAFVGEMDGAPTAQAVASLPFSAAARYVLPVVVDAVGTGESVTLTWPTFQNVPDAWRLTLRDVVTGEVVNLRDVESYTFSVAPAAARSADPASWLSGQAAQLASAPRLEIVIETGATVAASQDTPTVLTFDRVAPNPTSGAAQVRFGLPEAGAVSVAVFDMLGRQVATLVEGDRAAGWHTASLDARALSSGVYVVRLQTGAQVQTQRITVTR